MQFSDSFRDIPARRSVSEANVGDEKINCLSFPKPLERAGAGGGLQHCPSLLPKPAGDVLTHKPIILDDQGSQAI